MATRVHLNKKYKFIKKNKYTYFFKKKKFKLKKKRKKKEKGARSGPATPGHWGWPRATPRGGMDGPRPPLCYEGYDVKSGRV
jgi:hypothetical protein